MPFGLTNPNTLLQEMMHTIFYDIKECIWYLKTIVICGSNTEAEHQAIVEKVLQLCVEHGLVGKLL